MKPSIKTLTYEEVKKLVGNTLHISEENFIKAEVNGQEITCFYNVFIGISEKEGFFISAEDNRQSVRAIGTTVLKIVQK